MTERMQLNQISKFLIIQHNSTTSIEESSVIPFVDSLCSEYTHTHAHINSYFYERNL